MARKQAKSPYQKYQKQPYRYSVLFHQWMDAVKRGRHDEAARLGRQHTIAQLGYFPRRNAFGHEVRETA